MRLAGVHQPARHLLLSRTVCQQLKRHLKLYLQLSAIKQQQLSSVCFWVSDFIFCYCFWLVACHDVESHPGPDLLSPLAALSLSMMGMKLKLNQINKKTITTEDLFPVIEECIKQIVEITMKIKAKFKFKRVFIL
jgi:hypothetical protein